MKGMQAVGVLGLLVAPAAWAADLGVRLHNIQNSSHQVVVAVFRGAEGFPSLEAAVRQLRLEAQPPKVEAKLRDLEPGRYAVIAYHDEDGDGSMDRFLGMVPTEGYGLSRNPEVTGPPAFEDSAFELREGGAAIAIHMRY